MDTITLFLRKKLVLLALLFFGVITTQAVNISYVLTTHDGRTLNGTASISAGASLEANMPQDLWRGYTTYTYYSNPEMTNKITVAPDADATVYVDYFFDPPFQMSNDEKTVWNYLRNYNGGGSSHRFVYYDNGRIYSKGHTSESQMREDYSAHWAFYGDGYNFHIKSRLTNVTNPWLIWGGSQNRLQLGAQPTVGWQLYLNTASNNKRPGGTVALGRPDNKNLAYLEDLGIALQTKAITSDHRFDSKNQLVIAHPNGGTSQVTQEKNELWWYAFFGSPVTSYSTTTDIWHVTYKIRKGDGSWYPDIVVQKTSSNLTASFPPPGFTPIDDEDHYYYYFFPNEEFNGDEQLGETVVMTNDCNTVLYIMEVELVTTPWTTFVIPYDIDDLYGFFENRAEVVEVDILTGVRGILNQRADGNYYYDCDLQFEPTDKIEAYKPYLIRFGWVDRAIYNKLYEAAGIEVDEDECENNKITLADETNSPDITVTMKGVLTPNGYAMDASDGLSFYFGSTYDETQEDYIYKFYRRSATIPKNRCYFYVTDENGQYSPLNLSFGTGTTGINVQVPTGKKVDAPIYNLYGQMMNTKAGQLKKGLYIINGKKVIVK